MTICVSVRVAEGLVFAADSVVTLGSMEIQDGRHMMAVVPTFDYASKVTQLSDYPIGVMSWGLASIQDRTIQSLIMEFEHGYPPIKANEKYKLKTVARDLVKFLGKIYGGAFPPKAKDTPPPELRKLGVLIGGYSSNEFFAEQYQCNFHVSKKLETVRPNKPDGSPSFGSNWFGSTDALVRLVKGYDLDALTELVNRGVDKSIIDKWMEDNVPELALVFDGMPLQDGIDFAEYCIQVVIGRYRFGPGPALCGGDVDIAVIRPKSFEWARRKQWTIKD